MSPSTHTTTTISSCLSAILLLVLILSSGCHSQTECSSCDDCSCQPDYSKCVNDLDGINIEGLSDPPNGHCTDSAIRYVESGTVLLNCPEPLDVEVILVSWDFYPSASPDEKVVLNNTDMRFQSTNDQLTILGVEPGDEGLYICQIRVDGGPVFPLVAGCVIVHESAQLPPTTNVNAVDGGDIVLPTALIFTPAGSCKVRPRITEVELDCNSVPLIDCDVTSECVPTAEKPHNFYDFSKLGDIILPSSVGEGECVIFMRQCCPNVVLSMEYTVNFMSSIVRMSASTVPSTSSDSTPTATPTTTGPTGGTRPGSNDTLTGVIVAVVVIIILLVAAIVIIFIVVICNNNKKKQDTFQIRKEPIYETPQGENGVPLSIAHPPLIREESDYNFAPSSVGGDRNDGRSHFDEDYIYLPEKATDRVGDI